MADQALAQLGSIPYPQTTVDLEQMRENVVTFRRSIGQHARNLQDLFSNIVDSVKAAQLNMKEVNSVVDDQKRRVDKIVTDYQEQFSKGEETRRETFTSSEEKRVNQFSESELKRKEEFEHAFTDRKTQLDELLRVAESDAKNMSTKYEEQAGSDLKRLEAYRLDAQKLVGVIGTTGIIRGYQVVADAEAKTGRLWERLAVGAMGLLVVFGLYAFWLAHQENFNWHFLAARAMAVIPLGVFAAYAAHKAEQHRQIQRNSRRMELELAALNPYLATLPNDTQYEVKRLLAERFFANDGTKVESIKLPKQTGDASELLRPVLENIKLVLEAIKK